MPCLSILQRRATTIFPIVRKLDSVFGFPADYELLFETALGIYDYDIARAVARNSQMDPKVYLPLLKRYAALPSSMVDTKSISNQTIRVSTEEFVYFWCRQESLETSDQVAVEQQDLSLEIGNADHCMTLIEREKLHTLGLELSKLRAETTNNSVAQ
jgi:hypothetical protein